MVLLAEVQADVCALKQHDGLPVWPIAVNTRRNLAVGIDLGEAAGELLPFANVNGMRIILQES